MSDRRAMIERIDRIAAELAELRACIAEGIEVDGLTETALRWMGESIPLAPQESKLLRMLWPITKGLKASATVPLGNFFGPNGIWGSRYNPSDANCRGRVYRSTSRINGKISKWMQVRVSGDSLYFDVWGGEKN